MKKLVNLKGVKALSRNEQKSINGGIFPCGGETGCESQLGHSFCAWECINGYCVIVC